MVRFLKIWACMLLSAAVISPLRASADSGPRIQLGGYHFDDSGDFAHRYGRLGGRFPLTQKIFLEADGSHHWVSQESNRLRGSGVRLHLGHTFTEGWEGKMGVGLTSYEGIGADVSYLASLQMKPTHTSYLTLTFEHDNVVYKVSRLDALEEGITFDEFSPTLYQWISKRWSFWGQFALGRYSDSNLRTCLNSSLTYILKLDPSVSLSYALYYIGYKDRSTLYWDPQSYLAHTLIFGMQESIWDLLTINVRGSLGFSHTEKKRTNPGFSIRLSLPDSPRWGLDMAGKYTGDGRQDEYYSCTTTSINLFYLPW